MSEKLYDRARLDGHAIYRTANGTKAKRDFDLGTIEQIAVGAIDFEKVAEAIKERYEMFIRNKTNKAQYKLIGMELTVWTSGNTYKHVIIPVDD